ncbi:MAG: ABC transporter permease [Candidatus Hydrogenedentes bacterium]|nr:ABC transporter permease [Candidatus Hydrogenedentota bacterium]
MTVSDISYGQLAAGYILLLFPLTIFLWYGVALISDTIISMFRMTVQLLFVGFYLHVVFQWNNPWINFLWIAVMVIVADASIIRSCGLRLRRFALPLAAALFLGVLIPLLLFLLVIIRPDPVLDARYIIPIAGMILGNCLRADIVGIRGFYDSLRKQEKIYLRSLASGASLHEALLPFIREALEGALRPTIATMGAMGIVSLPGMMTGVILGGANPMTAIKYQIAIMLAIFSGTAITVVAAIFLTLQKSFTSYGILDKKIFTK